MLFNFKEIGAQKSVVANRRLPSVVFDESTASSLENFSKTAESTFDIFFSYRSLDRDDAEVLVRQISGFGLSVYVDWQNDPQLNSSKVTRNTAETLRCRLKQCRCLLYAATASAGTSTWMPWEVGYMDALNGRVAILPVGVDELSRVESVRKGHEYLSLYPYISKDMSKKTKKMTLWANETEECYCDFKSWINGSIPYKH